MENFNWLELIIGMLSAAIAYIAGHKVGKNKCEDK